MSNSLSQVYPRVILSADQIKKRVQEIARQISRDYHGRTLHVVAVMENGFIFMADLVRELDIPVVCQFVKGEFNDQHPSTMEIFYTPEVEVAGKDVLLVEALIQSGVTSEFLLRNLAEALPALNLRYFWTNRRPAGCHSSLITLVFC